MNRRGYLFYWAQENTTSTIHHMEIPGHIQNGVVVPDGVLSLPDGAEVLIVVPTRAGTKGHVMSADERSRYQDALARIDAVANENPGDAFSGADHDQALYGERG